MAAAADDLDDLIADSLTGVQSALDGERKAAEAASTADAAPAGASTEEAVKELQHGPKVEDPQNEQFFNNLLQSFQDESFQSSMATLLEGTSAASSSNGPPPGTGKSSTTVATSDWAPEDLFQDFMKSFESAVGNDDQFAKSLTTLMTSMLSNELVCEPIAQIANILEPWLQEQKNLSADERGHYEEQLRIYRAIESIYRKSPDPLPEPAREEVQSLLTELHSHGSPPDAVLRQIGPKDGGERDESFEEFIKSSGLGDSLGQAEQDMLKQLNENPEELAKAMQEMLGDGKVDENCKTQ